MAGKEYVIGIDPGREGAAVMLATDSSGWSMIKSHPSPTEFLQWTQSIGEDGRIVEVWVEELSGMQGDSPNTAFTLGTSYGIWQCFAQCICAEPGLIKPKLWQTRFIRMATRGAERYMPSKYGERKQRTWELVKEFNINCPKYAADAAAIALLKVDRYLKSKKTRTE